MRKFLFISTALALALSANVEIEIKTGWNLKGFPLSETKSVKDVFAGYYASIEKIWTFEGEWKDASELKSTNGYWILSKDEFIVSVESSEDVEIEEDADDSWSF